MIWTIWGFLIIWTIIAVIMICLKAPPVIVVGGSFLITIVLLVILHIIVKPPPLPSPEKIAGVEQKINSPDAGRGAGIKVKKSLNVSATERVRQIHAVGNLSRKTAL